MSPAEFHTQPWAPFTHRKIYLTNEVCDNGRLKLTFFNNDRFKVCGERSKSLYPTLPIAALRGLKIQKSVEA